MLRYNVRLTVHENTITITDNTGINYQERNLVDFPTTEEERKLIREDIEFHLANVHVLSDDGRVFALRVSNIEDIS